MTEQEIEAIEDAEDIAFALDYQHRKALGLLTPDEMDEIPLDQAVAELEAKWAKQESPT